MGVFIIIEFVNALTLMLPVLVDIAKVLVFLVLGTFTQHHFQLNRENFLCVFVVHLHNYSVLCVWKLLNTGFKVQVFENNSIIE